ncbi:hypothetical protein GCM10023259_014930 [Thermocatellispora tengchongensis]
MSLTGERSAIYRRLGVAGHGSRDAAGDGPATRAGSLADPPTLTARRSDVAAQPEETVHPKVIVSFPPAITEPAAPAWSQRDAGEVPEHRPGRAGAAPAPDRRPQ